MNSNDARAIQGHSTLHVLVVAKEASLELVSLAYSQDPTTLTEAVLEDAFRYGKSVPVLLFLAEKIKASPNELSEMMAKRFIHSIPTLQQSEEENDTVKTVKIIEQLKAICGAFPCSVIRTDHTTSPFCPMNIVIFSTIFPNELLDFMVDIAGKTSPLFSLLPLPDMLKIEDPHFRAQTRRELDDHCIQAICALVDKMRSFHCSFRESRTRFWTEKNFMTVLSAVFQSTSLTQVNLRPPCLANAKPEKQLLALVGRIGALSRINTFRIYFGAKPGGEPDFSILAPLVEMRQLKILSIDVDKRWKADKNLMEIIAQILERGILRSIELNASTDAHAVQAKAALLDAVGNSKSLAGIYLQCPGDPADEMRCRKQILEILQTNAVLTLAIIGEFPSKEDVREPKDKFLNGTYWTSEQRRINFLTLLNLCGRAKARDTTTTRTDFLRMLERENVQLRLSRLALQDYDVEQDFITNMQYGLLREAPAIWLPY